MAGDQRLDLHVGDELNKAHPAKTQRGTEGVEWVFTFTELDPIDLHLLARCSLEAHDGVYRPGRLEPVHKGAELAMAAKIALCFDLA